jgi:serine/threonine-protein kinase RsbW
MKRLKTKAILKNLDLFLEFIREFAGEEEDFDAGVSSDLVLVGEEVLVNIINYAYPNEKEGEVELCLSIKDNILTFCIIDGGVHFDMNLADDPDITLTVEEKNIGGMGIYLVKHFMDEVRYERKNGKNILTLIKYC